MKMLLFRLRTELETVRPNTRSSPFTDLFREVDAKRYHGVAVHGTKFTKSRQYAPSCTIIEHESVLYRMRAPMSCTGKRVTQVLSAPRSAPFSHPTNIVIQPVCRQITLIADRGTFLQLFRALLQPHACSQRLKSSGPLNTWILNLQ